MKTTEVVNSPSKPLRYVLLKRPPPNKRELRPRCLQRFFGHILYFAGRLGLSGLDWKKAPQGTGLDGQGASVLSIVRQTSCPSACSGALDQDDGATEQGIFN